MEKTRQYIYTPTWLKEEDCNTKKIDARLVWRARKNRIKKLEDVNDIVHTGIKEMGGAATEYFETIFTADPTIDHSLITDFLFQL